MWLGRIERQHLLRLTRQRPAVVVTGARQTGKTSLVRRTFPDAHYVTLDLPSEAEQAEREPSAFLERHPPPVIIDEVQYAPNVLKALKTRIDERRLARGQYILTGSQKFPLMKAISESLAGRVGLMELEGLTSVDIRAAYTDVSDAELTFRGTFPELWQDRSLDAADFFDAYIATYLQRDLRSLLAVGSLRDFERFVRACALRSAQLLNRAELARDVGIAPSTAGEWLAVLEASNIVCLLEPWFRNGTKTLVKSPKLYLCDTGLLCRLVGIRTEKELLGSPQRGAVWETLVASEVRKLSRFAGAGDPFFWRDRSREVDFLLLRGGRFDLYDAKWSEQPDSRVGAPLRRVANLLPEGSVNRRGIICRTENEYPMPDGTRVLGLADLWRANED